jgi:hypothetical protein
MEFSLQCGSGHSGQGSIVQGTKKTWDKKPRRNVQGHIDQGHNITSPEKGCDQYTYTDRIHIFHMFHARNQCVYNL